MKAHKRCLILSTMVVLGLSLIALRPTMLFGQDSEPPDESSPPDNLALNPNKSGYPHPMESDHGWGGGADKWDIVDGVRKEPTWDNGLAFTGGKNDYVEPCGWRQATINFGEPKTFNIVLVWHHSSSIPDRYDNAPITYKIQYWDGTDWVDIFSTTNGRDYLKYPTDAPQYWWESFSTPTENRFAPVTSSKVRFGFYNCDLIHGWFYEFEVYYMTTIQVSIDIKPGSCPNSINPNAGGVIPVAILTTADFDASTVNPEMVALEGASARSKGKSGKFGSMEDVDGDGDLDLVVQIENDIEWDPEATEATLTGQLNDGTPIEGSDCIRLVPDDDNNGDQMWVEIEFVPHAQMQTDISNNNAFYTGFGIWLWDFGLYAYNQGARSAIIAGPGLPEAGQVLEHYYPENVFGLYPKGGEWPASGGWGLWLDDTAISSIPDNATYTIGIYEETADAVSLSDTPLQSYTKTFAKGPMLNSELNASLFPSLVTPSSHDESVLDIPGIVDVSWSNPSNMLVDFINLGLHSPDWSTGYQIMKDVTPGDTSATLDTTSLPLDVLANQLYMHGTDIYGRRFGFAWALF